MKEIRRNSDVYSDGERKFIIQGRLVVAEESRDVFLPIPEGSKFTDPNFPKCPDCFKVLEESAKSRIGAFCNCGSDFYITDSDQRRSPYN